MQNTANDSSLWDAYNTLLLGADVERIRKIIARYELFRMTLDVPGDIVECGVLKGSSLMLFFEVACDFCIRFGQTRGWI